MVDEPQLGKGRNQSRSCDHKGIIGETSELPIISLLPISIRFTALVPVFFLFLSVKSRGNISWEQTSKEGTT